MKLWPNVNVPSSVHPVNMSRMPVAVLGEAASTALVVSNPDKFSSVMPAQPLNMPPNCATLGVVKPLTSSVVTWEHPANTAAILLDGKTIGTMSTVHPEVAAEIDKKASLVTLELDMDALAGIKEADLKYREASRFPGIDIDLSFVVDKDVTFKDVTSPFFEDRDETLAGISLVDIYEADVKSMTIRLSFVSPMKTLQKAEVQAYIDRILAVLAEKNIRLRTV